MGCAAEVTNRFAGSKQMVTNSMEVFQGNGVKWVVMYSAHPHFSVQVSVYQIRLTAPYTSSPYFSIYATRICAVMHSTKIRCVSLPACLHQNRRYHMISYFFSPTSHPCIFPMYYMIREKESLKKLQAWCDFMGRRKQARERIYTSLISAIENRERSELVLLPAGASRIIKSV